MFDLQMFVSNDNALVLRLAGIANLETRSVVGTGIREKLPSLRNRYFYEVQDVSNEMGLGEVLFCKSIKTQKQLRCDGNGSMISVMSIMIDAVLLYQRTLIDER
jgi:hypothetical protein